MNILITCPPMLAAIDRFRSLFEQCGLGISTPNVVQILSEKELIDLVPRFDGWIIGDDPATAAVFEAGRAGKLKAAVKWGVGVDNVDIAACNRLGISFSNTPGMFGREVADIAYGYIVALARETFAVDRGVKAGLWPKPAGISLADKTVALVGFGDIGKNTAKRLLAAEMRVVAYDPLFVSVSGLEAVKCATWPDNLEEADFIILTCALTPSSHRMLNAETFARCKRGVRLVNVSRGLLIDEPALEVALSEGVVHSVALEVLEHEPLMPTSPFLRFGDRCIFGSHNASNTVDAVDRTSRNAVRLITGFLGRSFK